MSELTPEELEKLKKAFNTGSLSSKSGLRLVALIVLLTRTQDKIEEGFQKDVSIAALKSHRLAAQIDVLEVLLKAHEETKLPMDEIVASIGLELIERMEQTNRQLNLFSEELVKISKQQDKRPASDPPETP